MDLCDFLVYFVVRSSPVMRNTLQVRIRLLHFYTKDLPAGKTGTCRSHYSGCLQVAVKGHCNGKNEPLPKSLPLIRMKSMSSMISLWSGALIILILIAGTISLIFTDFMEDRIYGNKRIFFIFLLLSYAAYRAWRLKKHLEAGKAE